MVGSPVVGSPVVCSLLYHPQAAQKRHYALKTNCTQSHNAACSSNLSDLRFKSLHLRTTEGRII